MSSEEVVVATNKNFKPHAVCIPYPVQSHIKSMLKFSKLLHHKGFYITFVNTEFNHNRFLKYSSFRKHLPGFRFETIPDGLPPSDHPDSTQDVPSLSDSTRKNFLAPFLKLINKLTNHNNTNDDDEDHDPLPPVSCIISDGMMTFGIDAAKQLRIPVVQFFTIAACAFMSLKQYRVLLEKGILPLKGEQYAILPLLVSHETCNSRANQR